MSYSSSCASRRHTTEQEGSFRFLSRRGANQKPVPLPSLNAISPHSAMALISTIDRNRRRNCQPGPHWKPESISTEDDLFRSHIISPSPKSLWYLLICSNSHWTNWLLSRSVSLCALLWSLSMHHCALRCTSGCAIKQFSFVTFRLLEWFIESLWYCKQKTTCIKPTKNAETTKMSSYVYTAFGKLRSSGYFK